MVRGRLRGKGAIAVSRADFQQLAEIRIQEAKVLLDAGKWDGAYYLGGYAVECALKACIAKRTSEYDFPPKVKFVQDCYTHDAETLLKAADLVSQRDTAAAADPAFDANWDVVSDWTGASRYDRDPEAEARKLYDAITDAAHGVLPWIRSHW
jgi:hypothetical protein